MQQLHKPEDTDEQKEQSVKELKQLMNLAKKISKRFDF